MPAFCPACGKILPEDAVAFCPYCGCPLNGLPTASLRPGSQQERRRSGRRLALICGGIILIIALCVGIVVYVIPALIGTAGSGGIPGFAGDAEYSPYTSAEDHFTLEVPQTWYISENDVSDHPSFFLNNITIPGVTLTQMTTVVSVSSPDAGIHTIITGMDCSLTGPASVSDDEILSGFLNRAIASVEQSLVSPVQYSAQETGNVGQSSSDFVPTQFNVTQDPRTYSINGMDCKHATLTPENRNGEVLGQLQVYVIKGKNAIYFLQNTYSSDAANDPASGTQAQQMLESFREST